MWRATDPLRTRAVLLGVVLGWSWGGSAATPAPEQLLGAETLMVLSIPNWTRAREHFDQSATGRLYADPVMKSHKDKFMSRLRGDLLKPLALDFGVKLDELAALAEGQLTLAYTPTGWTPTEHSSPAFVLVMDTGSHSNKLAEKLAELRQAWREAGRAAKPTKIRDLEFTILGFSSSDVDLLLDKAFPHPKEKAADPGTEPEPPAHPMEWVLGQSGSLLLLGRAPQDLERILQLQAGEPGARLAAQPAFAAEAASFREAQAFLWVNTKAVFDAMQTHTRPNREASVLPSLLEPLGLTGLHSVAGVWRQNAEGTAVSLSFRAPQAERKGLLQMIAPQALDAAPPSFVPASAVKFTRIRVDLLQTWKSAEAILAEAMPPLAAMVKGLIAAAGKDTDKSFDFRARVIDTLGDDLVTFEKGPRGGTIADLDDAPSLLLVGSRKPDQFAESLKGLVAGLPPELARYKQREFLGRTLFSLVPPLPGADDPATGRPRSLHYCASGGYGLFSAEASTLEDFLRAGDGKGGALREFPGLAEAAQKVGGMGTGGFTFENEAATWRARLEALRNASTSAAQLFGQTKWGNRLPAESQQLAGWFDGATLPPFEQIARYFHFTVSTLAATPEGLVIRAYWPTPPGLRPAK